MADHNSHGEPPNGPDITVPTVARGPDAPVRYIRSHAALRGIAALLVVAYHLQFGVPHRLWIEDATHFFRRGYLLVDLFFVLSGFVISLTGDADRSTPYGRRETYDFYVARLARIYPLHLFCLCYVTLAILALAGAAAWLPGAARGIRLDADAAGSFVAEMFLVQSWIPGAPRWNIPSWSISAELFAYALFPALVTLSALRPRVMRVIAVFVPTGFYLWVLAGSGSLDVIAGTAPLRCLAGFLVGMALFRQRNAVARWRPAALGAAQLVAGAAIVAMLALPVPDPLIVPFFALLVVTTWQDKGPAARLLCCRPLLRAGDLSYSIYLNHVCLITILMPVWYWLVAHTGLSAGIARVVLIAGCFAAVLIVSQGTYRYVEQSSRRYFRRRLARSARA